MILCISSLKNADNVANKAFTNNEKTIPKSIIVLLDIVLSIFAEKVITINTVVSPEINPTIGRVKLPNIGKVTPETITSPAPNDAPEDTPNVYGEANWFLSMDCTTAPLVAKQPPTRKANKTLGNLNFQIIDTSFISI